MVDTAQTASERMLEAALKEYGVEGSGGSDTTSRVLQYIKIDGLDQILKDDNIAWCGIFAGFCALSAGLTPPRPLELARNWLNFGQPVDQPQLGDVVVFWREDKVNSYKGHVALWIASSSSLVYTLGGNQGNKVCIAGRDRDRVLGYRRPI